MEVFWRERRAGLSLILSHDDGNEEEEVGGIRQTSRGCDAFAKTNTYDPGRSQKGIPTLEEAKAFVESFRPWELFGGEPGMEIDPEVRPMPGATTTSPEGSLPQSTQEEEGSQKERSWKFWRR